MGYIFDFKDAQVYDACFESLRAKHCLKLEIKLILKLLAAYKEERILDVGCGTGISLEPLVKFDLNLTGIDPSSYMLDKARQRLGKKVILQQAFAEDLPFEDNAFDKVLFFTSLEFIENPLKAIEEACRVAKDQVVIGVLNRYALLNIGRQIRRCLFDNTIYAKARFFSIWELKQMLYNILGDVPMLSRTTLQFPLIRGRIVTWFENLDFIQKSCYGTLIGMQIKPIPKFRTTPLGLRILEEKKYSMVEGLVSMDPLVQCFGQFLEINKAQKHNPLE